MIYKIRKYWLEILLFIFISLLYLKNAFTVGYFSFWATGDAQTFNAAMNFFNYGFFNNNFLPLISPGSTHDLVFNNGPNGRYFHYPAIHSSLLGILFIFMNYIYEINNFEINHLLWISQSIFFLFSLVSFFLIYKILNFYFSKYYSFLLIIPFVVNGWFYNFSFSLADQPLHNLFWYLNILFVCNYLTNDKKITNKTIFYFFILLFMSGRNSVETPILIFCFNFLIFLYDFNSKKDSIKKYIIFFIAMLLGLVGSYLIQFIQSLYEYNFIIDNFYDHWRNIFTNKIPFNTNNITLVFSTLLNIDNLFFYKIISLLLISYCVFKNLYFLDKKSKDLFFIILSYLFSLLFLFCFIPKQMNSMSYYTKYYWLFFHIFSLYSFFYIFLNNKILFNKKILFIFIVFFFSLNLYSSIFEVKKFVNNYLYPSNIYNIDSSFWGFSDNNKIGFSVIKDKSVFGNVRKMTNPFDILIAPDYFLMNYAIEPNIVIETTPILELYYQRHILPNRLLVDIGKKNICNFLKIHIHNLNNIFILNENGEIESQLVCKDNDKS